MVFEKGLPEVPHFSGQPEFIIQRVDT